MEHPLDLRRLEELGLNSSAPPGQLLFDGWLLRLLPGQARRARSVNALYPSRLPIPDKIRHCERLYRAHQLPTIFRITPFSEPAGLDATLHQVGYRQFDMTAVETTTIPDALPPAVQAEAMPLPAWVEAVGALRGSPPAYRAGHLQRLQALSLPLRALAIRQGGEVLATGLTVVEDDWAGLFDIVTAAAARRQGLGRRIVESLLQGATPLGARRAYLQVDAGNIAARRLYAHYGFAERYRYWYRIHPEAHE